MAVLVELSDDQFQKDLTSRCKLSMELGQDRCALAILDTLSNKVVYLLEFNVPGTPTVIRTLSELDKITGERPWLLRAFESTRALIRHCRFALVPSDLVEKGKESSYLSILGFQNPNTIHRFHELSLPEANIVFDLSNSLVENLERNWPGIDIKCYESVFAEEAARRLDEGDIFSANLNVDGLSHFQIALYKGRNLQFLNTFHFKNKEDLLYYLLAVLEAHQLAPNSISLKLSGDISREGELYSSLYKFVRNVSFVGRDTELLFSSLFDGVAAHRFMTLMASLR